LSTREAKIIAIVVAAGFLVFGQMSSILLPGYFSNDTQNMVDIAEGLAVGYDVSLAVIAALIGMFSLPGLTLMVQLAGMVIVFYLMAPRRLVFTQLLALYSLALTAPLSLVRPQKELLVFLLTAVCVWIINRVKTERAALIWTVLAYAIYLAVSLRPYYVLIIGAMLFLTLFVRRSAGGKLGILLVVFLLGFLIPNSLLEMLRLLRDAINDLRVLYPDLPGNRTAFSNPLVGAGWIGFVGNYVYAAIRLNLPLLFSVTPSELALNIFSLTWFYAMAKGYRTRDWRARFMVRLIMSHLLVMWIFEPDLGSYLRHFSSLILYLSPIFAAIESKYIDGREGHLRASPAPGHWQGAAG
jgi:hypothetical protein